MSEYLKRVSDIRQDPDQQAAFDSLESQVVIAGPGSGKTYLLTTKVARTLFEGVVRYPHKVACVTFSRQLAAKLEKELQQLGVDENECMYVGTVHAFCIAEIVMPAARLLPLSQVPKPFRIASQQEMINALSQALREQNTVPPNGQQEQRNIKSNLDKYRRLHFLPEHDDFDTVSMPEADGYSRNSLVGLDWRQFARVYHRFLIHNNPPGVDFVYVEMLALKALHKFPIFASTLSAKYPWWFVDEYQDLSPLFHHMVTRLVESGQISVFAIGDPNQCIYEELHGSKPDYLTDLANLVRRVSGSQLVTLKTNYRSAQDIINVENVILGKETGYQSRLQGHGSCYAVELTGSQLINIVGRILRKIESRTPGSKPQSIAVLVRTRRQLADMLRKLEQCKGWKISTDKDPDFSIDLELVEWVQSLAQWCVGKVYYHEVLPFWNSLHQAVYGLHDLQHQLGHELFDALWDIRDGNCLLHTWLELLENRVLDQTALNAYEKVRPDDVAELKQLYTTATNMPRLSQKSVRWFGQRDGDVFLTTFHSSKGLEFDAVIVVDLDGIIPSPNAPDLKSRLAYVAISRAKTDLFVLIPAQGGMFAQKLVTQPKDVLGYWRYNTQSGVPQCLNR